MPDGLCDSGRKCNERSSAADEMERASSFYHVSSYHFSIVEETTKEAKCDFALAPYVTFTASAMFLRQITLFKTSLLSPESGGDVSAV